VIEAEGRAAIEHLPGQLGGHAGVLHHQAAPPLLSPETVQALQDQEVSEQSGAQPGAGRPAPPCGLYNVERLASAQARLLWLAELSAPPDGGISGEPTAPATRPLCHDAGSDDAEGAAGRGGGSLPRSTSSSAGLEALDAAQVAPGSAGAGAQRRAAADGAATCAPACGLPPRPPPDIWPPHPTPLLSTPSCNAAGASGKAAIVAEPAGPVLQQAKERAQQEGLLGQPAPGAAAAEQAEAQAGQPPSTLFFNLIPTREFGLKLLKFPSRVWLQVGRLGQWCAARHQERMPSAH
jgi:hypothetical protein